MLKKLIDRLVEASLQRAAHREKIKRLTEDAPQQPLLRSTNLSVDGPPTGRVRQFTVHDAMNGTYIEFAKRKYNPNGPDEYAREIYLVQPGEALIDAISTVLVLMEK
jgi:hypothetical protein